MVEDRAVKAGLLYCAVVFSAGFVLGGMRTFFVGPLAGEFVGVLVEAPVILAISWTVCAWVAEHLDVSQRFLDRLVMGGVALVMLVSAEAVVALLNGDYTLAEFFQNDCRSAILLGLLAQLAFAVFPILQRRRRRA